MFANAVKLCTVKGFEIKLDPSWILIAALITWSLARQYFPSALPDLDLPTYIAMAVLAMLGFFASLVLHELAHAVVARHMGVQINGITLFLFGGVAELESEPPAPGVEFWIAVAGPLMSLCLALGFWMLSIVFELIPRGAEWMHILFYLALINAVLAVFNLLPAFPMDGGRILRAVVWHRSGDLMHATRVAAKSGVVLAYALIGLGLLTLLWGALLAGFWQIMIGVFVLVAAQSSYQRQLAHVVFAGMTVRDVMVHDPVVVGPDMSLADFVSRIMLRHGVSLAPVVENGVLLGHIDRQMLSKIDPENWANTHVGDVFAGFDGAATIAPGMPVQDVMEMISTSGRRKFMVVQDKDLVGILSLADLTRFLAIHKTSVGAARE